MVQNRQTKDANSSRFLFQTLTMVLVVVARIFFSSHARIPDGRFDKSFPACSPPPLFLKWRSSCAFLFHCLGQDRSTVAQLSETTVDKRLF